MLTDRYGRVVDRLRISITQRCMFRCFFCHREGEVGTPRGEMTVEEIAKIAEIAYRFDIRKFKLTGGEPLLREDVVDVVSAINNLGPLDDLGMTTNGYLLRELAEPLREAGLMRVNVSLPSLKPRVFKQITGLDGLGKVLDGVEAAVEAGLSPVKLNMVVLKGVNEDEVWSMVDFAGEVGAILQVIELETSNVSDDIFKRFHADISWIERELERRASKVYVRRLHRRRRYVLPDGVEVEVVKPMHNTEFCANCTRMRVTSDGYLKPCLLRSDNHVDILTALRRGASDEELKRIFLKAVELREPFFKPQV
ncbi:MAG: molybdenum cofactor biosynthesis protein MoeA [Candidatus Bathyarchaeota archaeon B24]|nr:MAG: molybdenum cofactor biosynthesis protein MoeA [Candidatus Bathyarchaeota archaeon B24]